MRIWLIGADQTGTAVLRELKKNPEIAVVVSDVTDQPRAVLERVIPKVDFVETVTPVNVNQLARRIRPDLILIDGRAARRNLARISGGAEFAEALQGEIVAASQTPCILLT